MNNKIRNIYFYALFAVIIPIVLLQLSGILQPLQQMHYDFSFKLKFIEPQDRQIVIVDWKDQSFQDTGSSLTLLLKKISEQNPLAIGLCFENDFFTSYSNLQNRIDGSSRENLPLEQLFSWDGQILEDKSLLTLRTPELYALSSKVPIDSDFRIRRFSLSVNDDKTSLKSHINTSRAYIGVALAQKYLMENGWVTEFTPEQIKFLKPNQEITLKPDQRLFNFLNFYQRDKSLSFLINWRKAKNASPFNRVSANSVLNNQVPHNFFQNRIVIVGDSYEYGNVIQTPLERWQKNKTTDSATVAAHVASSIINRAEKNRALIKIAPWWLNLLILTLVVVSFAYLADTRFRSKITLKELRSLLVLYSVILVVLSSCLGWILLLTWGLWIDVAPVLLAAPWSLILFSSICQNVKEEQDFFYLRLLLRDFKHNINNISRNISSSNRGSKRISDDISKILQEDLEMLGEDEIDLDSTPMGKNLQNLETRFQNINDQITRINRYEKRVTNFLEYTYSNRISTIEEIDLNASIKDIVFNCLEDNILDYKIQLNDIYDYSIDTVLLHQEDLQILVENLLDNAINAINPELNLNKSQTPEINITTINGDRDIKIIIEDNGIGIPLSHQKEIFSPFVSLMDGQGIGLYLVYQIVSSLKGTLVLESEINAGSKFIISLPKNY